MSGRLPVSSAQRRLAAAWVVLGLPSMGLLFVQTISDGSVFGGGSKQVWAWLLPLVVPTLTLVLSTVAAEATQPESSATASRAAYRIALWLSVVYLLTVTATLVLIARSTQPLRLLDTASLFLSALQGLVGISLGAFFVSASGDRSATPARPQAPARR